MIDIKLYDSSFSPDLGSSKHYPPKLVNWIRGLQSINNPIRVYTDLMLNLVNTAPKDTYKVAWIIEPFAINPNPYQYVKENYDKFDLILSHHENLQSLGDKVKWYPSGMCWVDETDWAIYPKSKDISIIASAKAYAPGHTKRHQIIKEFGHLFDVYGYGYKPVEKKLEALKDYRFSIAVENCIVDEYWTEKQIDCFLTGTVPVAYCTRKILRHFNQDGILIFDNLTDLSKILFDIKSNPQWVYETKCLKAVQENFEIAKSFVCPDDYIVKNYLEPLLV